MAYESQTSPSLAVSVSKSVSSVHVPEPFEVESVALPMESEASLSFFSVECVDISYN